MIRRPPRSTLDRSSAASDVYKRQSAASGEEAIRKILAAKPDLVLMDIRIKGDIDGILSLIHISEPTRPY